jgi:tetratricopeptide (TPR) repeat protein
MPAKKIWFFCFAFALSIFGSTAFATEVSDTLNKVQGFIQQKNYEGARSLLIDKLKAYQNEYKLWLALGHVYEAEENFDMALKAFMYASELKTNIPGLSDRIIRLQEVVKNNNGTKRTKESQSLIDKARYLVSFGKKLEGFKTFFEAVEADRSILSSDYGLIREGLYYFEENQNQLPEADFFLGAFNYYAGQYSKAVKYFENFIDANEPSPRQEDAKRLLQESREIIRGLKSQAPVTAKVEKPIKPATPSKKPDEKSPQKPKLPPPSIEGSTQITEKYSEESGESFAITLAKNKALKLLEEYDRETDERKKLQIIWRLGLIRLPLPEVMAKFAEFLGSDDIQTTIATLEALTKIGQPGAKICAPYIIVLLDHSDYRIKWYTVRTLSALPLAADKAIPRLLKIYKNESRASRQGLVVDTVYAYGDRAKAILRKMLSEALGPNKRPIAEILSVLTGENIEVLIRDS